MEECRDLRLRLENIEAVTTRLHGNQMEMKDHFGKLLEKLQASVSEIEERMNESETNLNRDRLRLGALDGQLSENHCSLLLEKLQASVSKIEERMNESETNLDREGRLGRLEGQLSENHCSLLDSPVIPAWADETPSKVTESLLLSYSIFIYVLKKRPHCETNESTQLLFHIHCK
ncbi:putative leucine-rich repeat-containing protein DDB_G0290503 [Montipora foliosa]|uniref:putative leucine-rich repeat-containing protein DDB_G0290503 n=1 Tax=Montipora foliosa TaxID=591990 RepID=UPI0035F14E8A